MAPVVTEPTDPEPSEPTEPAEGFAVKLNFMKPDSWSTVNAYLWQTSGAVPGYESYNTWGKDGQNYTFEVTAACDVTITFNHSSKAVKAEGDYVAAVTTLEISSITAVGLDGDALFHYPAVMPLPGQVLYSL